MNGRKRGRLVKVYLDNCCFNRPFDDQQRLKIKLETEAKLSIQQKILLGHYELVWSYILEAENNHNPFKERHSAIADWKNIAKIHCTETNEIIIFAESLYLLNIHAKDALHIACAVFTKCDYFITTDKKLYNTTIREIPIVNPLTFISELED